MHPQEIAASYDRIASHWAGEDFPRTNGLPAHQRALQFVASRGQALDVGCGCSGRFIDLLAAEGFAIEGLDASAEMIRLARLRNPAAVFHQADIGVWQPPGKYAFITAWDSLWHVPHDRQESVLKKLCGALTQGGVLIWTTGGTDGPEEKRDALLGVPLHYSVMGIPRTLQVIAEAGCVCRHLEYDQLPEKHIVLIAQKV